MFGAPCWLYVWATAGPFLWTILPLQSCQQVAWLRAGEEPNWWEQIKKEAPEMEQEEETAEEQEVVQELDYDDEF